ncbi:hypothetical protein [Microbacterium sp. KR10-403]|uniref:VG15 protein n=1 Tax=Microbacterium sp. KR10-403 TaxID=3158581 RepID=UPI0032E402DF
MADERALIEQYRQDLFHLTNMARKDLADFLYQVKGLPVAQVRDLLIQVMPDLVNPYLSASGELSATWYEDLRSAVGARGQFYAQTDTRWVQQSQANAVSRWAVGALTQDIDDPNALLLSKLGGAVQRMVLDSARGVVEGNVVRDPVRVGYQRMPRPGCCAFCGMLASRGAVYRSSESAGGVVGRGSTRTGFSASGKRLAGGIGQGIKARGQMNLGDRYHDDCHCIVMPVFFGTPLAEIANIEQKKYLGMYSDVAGGTTKEILASWRLEHGTN